jgi:hypothetical protein
VRKVRVKIEIELDVETKQPPTLSRYCAAAHELYFSCMPIPLVYPPSGPYDSMKLLNASLPPSCQVSHRPTRRLGCAAPFPTLYPPSSS